ncbi:flavin monoamine oxidase family protein [Halomonas alkaliantarctica]|uniref:flavin monoamine oxidase family protein n=1 Tax=Halomonas alkaliantarctica TaxID=232346 RepID=UPI00265AD798|nr:FAD-dependent oxidoreductase [Halomonas alkaliantarctica]
MHTTRIAIVGGGLAGLYAAYLLEQQGISDFVLLEGRDELGGRIASVTPEGKSAPGQQPEAFDMGPSWFWPGFQHALGALVESLGIVSFAQFETGDMLVERTLNGTSVRMQGFVNTPPSMRLKGGMSVLIEALRQRVDAQRIVTGQTVERLSFNGEAVELLSEDKGGLIQRYYADHVLLAVPPRLAEQRITFSPALPVSLAHQWRHTATWMAPHAKYVALFPTPFWREHGLSGEARSLIGPLGEIHDASDPSGHGALFGFFSVPASARKNSRENVLRQRCRDQLIRLFGPQAGTPVIDIIKDWAVEPLTATASDCQLGEHSTPPPASALEGPWQHRLTGIGSEWGQQYPGYLAGAIEAAERGVSGLLASGQLFSADR